MKLKPGAHPGGAGRSVGEQVEHRHLDPRAHARVGEVGSAGDATERGRDRRAGVVVVDHARVDV